MKRKRSLFYLNGAADVPENKGHGRILSALFCVFFLLCVLGGGVLARTANGYLTSFLRFCTLSAVESFTQASFWKSALFFFGISCAFTLIFGGLSYSAFGIPVFILLAAGQGSAVGAVCSSVYTLYEARGVLVNVAVIAPVAAVTAFFESRIFANGLFVSADILSHCFKKAELTAENYNARFRRAFLWSIAGGFICAVYYALLGLLLGDIIVG